MRRRNRRLQKLLLGRSPHLSPTGAVGMIIAVVGSAYVCAHFKLLHAHEYAMVAMPTVVCFYLVRRYIWEKNHPVTPNDPFSTPSQMPPAPTPPAP